MDILLQMVDVQVTLHWLEVGRGTSDSVVSAAVVQCLRKVRHHCILFRDDNYVFVVCNVPEE